jgi:glycosyltransferase involved in cell wall biosynthesis
MNDSSKSISIIIPTFNDANFLKSCLASIASQSVLPDEVLVIDDGSEDHSASAVCNELDFNKLKIKFYKISNSGPSAARNYGHEKSSSAFVLFLDADDFLPMDTIKKYLEELDTLPKDYFGICGRMNNFGKIFNARSFFISEERVNPALLGRPGELQGQISCYLLRSSAFQLVSGFDEGLSHYEDFDLILRLLKLNKIRTLKNVVLFKRFHKLSQSNKNFRKSYWGTKKFLYSSREKNLLPEEEILFRLRENLFSYGKQLFLHSKIFEAVKNFSLAFHNYQPRTFKEIAAYILCKGFNFFLQINLYQLNSSFKSSYSIAIVIPTYNDEEFLMETLGSVFDQSVLPDEIILIDDGSDKSYASKYINFFYHGKVAITQKRILNSGPSFARNIGASLAKSDFVLFLDSDDLLDRNAVSSLHDHISNFDFKNNWGVHGGISFLGSFKNYLPDPALNLDKPTLNKIGKNKTLEGLSSFLFSRISFLKVEGFRDTLSHNEDFDIILRLSCNQSVKPMLKRMVLIRKRMGSLSNRSARNSYDGVKIFLDIASAENLLDNEEIVIRKKENTLTYGKSLFYEAKISESLLMFNESFKIDSPRGSKEHLAFFLSKWYVFFISITGRNQ